VAKLTDIHNPSFTLLPVNNNRTAWRPFGLPVVMVVPHKRDAAGNTFANSGVFSVRVYIEDVPQEARVAGHQNIGRRFPDKELYAVTVSALDLADRLLDLSNLLITRDGVEISIDEAKQGDLINYTTATGVNDTIPFLVGADYYDLSDILIDVELLPSGQYNLVYEAGYFKRVISLDGRNDFLCIDANVRALAILKFQIDHPGRVLEEFYRLTPPPYLTNASKSKDTTVALYRPLTDLLQDVMDEQDLLERINWVFEAPAEAIPYLSNLLGWDIPYFPESLDQLRRAVLRRTVEFQNLKGSRRAIINIFRLFGFEVLISNLWWSYDGKRLIRPDEKLPITYGNQEIVTVPVDQVDPIVADEEITGFTTVQIPLLFRPQEKTGLDQFTALRDSGHITVTFYAVEPGSDAQLALDDIVKKIKADPAGWGNTANCQKDADGFTFPQVITDALTGKELAGYSQLQISGKLGEVADEIIVGKHIPVRSSGLSLNRENNFLKVTYNGFSDLEGLRVYGFATYQRFEFHVPDILADLQSNRFDLQVLTQALDEFADPTTLEFAVEFLYKLKAFHSLLNVIRTRIELTETYEVTDLCCLPGTMITMGDGTQVPIEHLRKGDFVLGHDGLPHVVTEVMCRFINEEIIEIKAAGTGRRLQMTSNHPLMSLARDQATYLKSRKVRSRRNPRAYYRLPSSDSYVWTSAENINPGDLLRAPKPATPDDQTLTTEQAEFLGYYAAKGDARFGRSHCVRFSLAANELDVAERICQLGRLLGATSASFKLSGSRIAVYVYGAAIVELCLLHCGHGARTKRLSKQVINSSWPVASEFIKAYFIGNGSLTGGTAPRCHSTSASADLTDQLYWMLARHGIAATRIYTTQQGGPTNRKRKFFISKLNVPSNSARRLWPSLRPAKLNMPCRHWFAGDHIAIRVEEVLCKPYIGPVYNIEVDAVHSYVANGVTVHNCVGGDFEQRYDTDIGRLQVPPAIIPKIPGDLSDCSLLDARSLGYKDSDIQLRVRKLTNLPEEHAAWKALDGREFVQPAGSRILPNQPAAGRDACKFNPYGQDRKTTEGRVEGWDTQLGPTPLSNSGAVGFSNSHELSPQDEAGQSTSTNSDSSAYGSFMREFRETPEAFCDLDRVTDYCYKGRVDDELLYRPTFIGQEPGGIRPINISLGVGAYWMFPALSRQILPGVRKKDSRSKTVKMKFSGKATEATRYYFAEGIQGEYLNQPYDQKQGKSKLSLLGRLYRDYGMPTTETLHFSNRPGSPNTDQKYQLALQRPNLEITKPTLHFPGCRFPTLNRLKRDFVSEYYEARPWDFDVCGVKNVCGKTDPNFLNFKIVVGTDGNEYLTFDSQPYTVAGNNLDADIPSLGDQTLVTDAAFTQSDVVHKVYMGDATDNPAVVLDGVVEYNTAVADGMIDTTDPLFSSHAACATDPNAFTDFADGYPAVVGLQDYEPPDATPYDALLTEMGLPAPPGTGQEVLFLLSSGIKDGSKCIRLDGGCLLADCNPTTGQATICSTDSYLDDDGNLDFEPDHLLLEARLIGDEGFTAELTLLDGTIPSLLETV
jgi:hypothetical protein